jgi:hypothetical protein
MYRFLAMLSVCAIIGCQSQNGDPEKRDHTSYFIEVQPPIRASQSIQAGVDEGFGLYLKNEHSGPAFFATGPFPTGEHFVVRAHWWKSMPKSNQWSETLIDFVPVSGWYVISAKQSGDTIDFVVYSRDERKIVWSRKQQIEEHR